MPYMLGYNQYGAANDIIMIYPQVRAMKTPNSLGKVNNEGYWDNWSYTGDAWDTREGVQPKFLMNLIEWVQGNLGEEDGICAQIRKNRGETLQ